MLARLIDLSLRHRAVVIAASALLALFGLASLTRLPFDAFPDTTPVQVSVNTVAPALSPLEVERQITFTLEQAIGGLVGLQVVRSISKFGFSQIVAVFDDGVDVYLARQVLMERLQAVELPPGVGRPSLGPVSTGLGEVFQYLLTSDGRLSPTELRTLHHWVVRPRMLQVPGVAEINSWGGYQRQVHVIVDPQQLLKHALRLDDVAQALRANNANVSGGIVAAGGEARLVQGIGLAATEEEIGAIVVAAIRGVPILISDVARVETGHEIRRGAVTADGQGEVVLGLGFMLLGENSRTLARRLEKRLVELQRSLPAGVTLKPVYSRTTLVDRVLRTVRDNLLAGAVLVVAVLFAFLGSLRAGLIVALAIPLSMLFAFNAMLSFGIAGSLMSLGAIDFGLVVDSSVIMVENASHRLATDAGGRPAREIVRAAALEVRRPTLFGELIIAIVYLPVLALEGIEGKLFRPLALTVIFALAGSMVLSLTLMPALSSLLLPRRRRAAENRLVRWLKGCYGRLLAAALRQRALVLGVAVLLVANAVFVALRLGSEFVPRLREQSIVINTVRLAGVSLAESVRYGTQIERKLLAEFPDEIAHIWTRTGTAEVATDPMGLELSDVFITLSPRRSWRRATSQDALVRELSAALEGMPGMRMTFTQPIEMRVNEMLAGIRADVGIKLFGDDFDILEVKAAELRRVVASTAGAADVTVEQVTGQPTLEIEIDRQALARHGVAAQRVLQLIGALGTSKVGQVIAGQRRFDLALRLPERYRDDPRRLGTILVDAPSGGRIPLAQLVTMRTTTGPSTINREGARRRIVVQANVRGRDVGSFVSELRRAVAERVSLPAGYHVQFGGQFEQLGRARTRLLLVVPLALLLIFMLLYLSFGEARDALLVFSAVPLAAVGGVAALWTRGLPFSISAGVGLVALFGVSVLGQLVLVSRIRQLRRDGQPHLQAIETAAQTRLRPVLMTGLVAALGFLPLALNTGVGAEVQRPLATVVVGGVLTSTLATMIVMPVLYALFGSGRREQLPDEAGDAEGR